MKEFLNKELITRIKIYLKNQEKGIRLAGSEMLKRVNVRN